MKTDVVKVALIMVLGASACTGGPLATPGGGADAGPPNGWTVLATNVAPTTLGIAVDGERVYYPAMDGVDIGSWSIAAVPSQ
jgi:hypothetical protein